MQNVAPQIVTVSRDVPNAVPASQVTDAPTCSATAVDDTQFDIAVTGRARDPFIGDCPSWCEMKDGGHEVVYIEEDRVHHSRFFSVPLRLHVLEPEHKDGFIVRYDIQTVQLYLDRDDLARDPIVRLERSETTREEAIGERDLALTLGEAAALGAKLTELARLGSEPR